jgi:heat-inducible transcriptional repressor
MPALKGSQDMDLGDRKKRILRAVIDQYIETAEPVGSKSVQKNIGINVSPATIRSEMAELESLGLLEQPHTSAGRVPTPQGYRIYVNELMRQHRLSLEETEAINHTLRSRIQPLDKLLSDVGKLVSSLTSYPAYTLATADSGATISRFDIIHVDSNTFIIVVMLSNKTVKNKLVRLPFSVEQSTLVKIAALFNAGFTNKSEDKITPHLISSTERAAGDEMGIVAIIAGFVMEVLYEAKVREPFVAGASSLLDYPEYRDVEKAQRLLSYLSDENALAKIPGPAPEDSGGMKITIGPENLAEELRDSSVVVARYDAGDEMQGLIGIVGPTRMDYSKVAARLAYIARGLSWLLSSGGGAPELWNTHDKSPPKRDTDF